MKPAIPSNREIAAEFGITPETPGWKQRVQEVRPESKLQAEYEAALAEWEETDEAAQLQQINDDYTAKREAREERLRAAGLSYLIGAEIVKSKRGTVAARIHGPGYNKARVITATACKILGHQPGPGNFDD